jgi:hypothetical protein
MKSARKGSRLSVATGVVNRKSENLETNITFLEPYWMVSKMKFNAVVCPRQWDSHCCVMPCLITMIGVVGLDGSH